MKENNKEAILEQVKIRHWYVQQQVSPSLVLMTVLVGSQNYGLQTEQSDIDTYSFILPPFGTFIQDRQLDNFEFTFPDGGKACVKDFRAYMKLLRKPTPNSIECLLSKYKVYDKNFEGIFDRFLNNEYMLYSLAHANFTNMIKSTVGCMASLHGRNMSEGKRTAHFIRLYYLMRHYCDWRQPVDDYLSLYGHQLTYAQAAKEQHLSAAVMAELQDLYLKKAQDFKNNYIVSENDNSQEFMSEHNLKKFEQEIIITYFALYGVRVRQ